MKRLLLLALAVGVVALAAPQVEARKDNVRIARAAAVSAASAPTNYFCSVRNRYRMS
jgi:hypothetical protein